MPEAPSEPEKYSLDEMMERLKAKPSEGSAPEGERVVRADGTEAIRVRKRKRRSKQPVKEQNEKKRRVQMVQVAVLLVLLILLVLGGGILFAYSNSAAFRTSLLQKIERASGAEAELNRFRMTPAGANAGSLSLKWPEGNLIESLQASGLSSDVSPFNFFGSSWSGDELMASQAMLRLRVPAAGSPRVIPAYGQGAAPVRFQRIGVGKLDLVTGTGNSSPFQIKNAQVSLYPEGNSGNTELRISKGDVSIPGWPASRIERATLAVKGDSLEIQSMILSSPQHEGVMNLSGPFTPYALEQLTQFEVGLETYPTANLFGKELARLISGMVDTRQGEEANRLSFSAADSGKVTMDLAFQASRDHRFELSGFPFQQLLIQTTENDWYARPDFSEQASGHFIREGKSVRLEQLHFESPGQMVILGELAADAEQNLSGTLRIGVPEAALFTAPAQRLEEIFVTNQDGYRWLTLSIGGTTVTPTDNFAELFRGTESSSSEQPRNEARPSFEELTQPR